MATYMFKKYDYDEKLSVRLLTPSNECSKLRKNYIIQMDKWKIKDYRRIQDRSSHQRCYVKKGFSKISQNSQENTCARVFLFIKKENLSKKFSCELGEIFWEHLFYRTPLVATSARTILNFYEGASFCENS